MSRYSQLTQKDIVQIALEHDIKDVLSFRIMSGGSENTNYKIRTPKDSYVITICEQKSVYEASQLAKLLVYLSTNQFNTSRIIPHKNGLTQITWRNKPIMVKRYLEGFIKQNLSPHLLRLVGRQLGKLHQIPTPDYLPTHLNYGKEKFSEIDKYAAETPFSIWLKKIDKYITPYLNTALPKCIIHSDLFWDNIIVNKEQTAVTIMDFEEATHYYRVFDIGMTIVGICSDGDVINWDKALYFLKGYQEEIRLLEKELRALKPFTVYAAASMTFWRHQNFNYVKPDPEMYDHYLELKVLADYVLEQDDNCLSRMIN